MVVIGIKLECEINHCVQTVPIRSFFWSVFSQLWTNYGDLQSKSTYSLGEHKGNTRFRKDAKKKKKI